MSSLNKKANIIFYRISAIGALVLAIFVFLGVVLYDRIGLALAGLGGRLETLCGCINHLSFGSHPWLFTFLTLSAVLVISFFGFTLIKTLKIKIKTSNYIKAHLGYRKKMSRKLGELASSLHLQDKIIEVDSPNPTVFCYGFIRPKICISSSFVASLDKSELKAVLLHEKHHLENNENVKLFIIKIVSSAFFFIPGLKSLAKSYFTLSELAADEWAIDGSENKKPLVGAMYKIIELNEQLSMENGLAVASFGSITEERIKKMTSDSYVFKLNIVRSKLLAKAFLVFSIIFTFTFLIYSSNKVMASHEQSVCSMDHGVYNQDCEMLVNGSKCAMYQGRELLSSGDCETDNLIVSPYDKLK